VLAAVLSTVVALATAAGIALLLSTAEVQARDLQVLGLTVSGVSRSFGWSSVLVQGSLCWFLALFWFWALLMPYSPSPSLT
jgi:hypothetical protein